MCSEHVQPQLRDRRLPRPVVRVTSPKLWPRSGELFPIIRYGVSLHYWWSIMYDATTGCTVYMKYTNRRITMYDPLMTGSLGYVTCDFVEL